MEIIKQLILVSLTVETEGNLQVNSLRDNVLDGVIRQRNNIGLTADDDASFVRGVEVLNRNTVFTVFSREQGSNGEVTKVHGVRTEQAVAEELARSIATTLANEFQSEHHRDVSVEALPGDTDDKGFGLYVDDEGAVAFVLVQESEIA